MSESPSRKPRDATAGFRPRFKDVLVRAWSLAIMLVIIWTAVMAVVYMVLYVLRPAELPAWVQEGQPSLHKGVAWPDLAAGAPKTPMSHYHKVRVSIRPGLFDNCTTSGCHQPLPHSRSKEIRAFANFHTSFVSCELCHDKTITGLVQVAWRDKTTGRPRGAPAALLLMRQLEVDADRIEKEPDAEHATIVDRLSAFIQESGTDPLLASLLMRIQAAEPGSPAWRSAVSRLRQDMAGYVTGEYGATLALARSETERARQRGQMAGLTGEFVSSPVGSPRRVEAHRRIHERVLSRPSGCIACHGGTTCRIDYAALEYPPSRQQALRHLSVAALIQMDRQRYHHPEKRQPVPGDGDASKAPASAPAAPTR